MNNKSVTDVILSKKREGKKILAITCPRLSMDTLRMLSQGKNKGHKFVQEMQGIFVKMGDKDA